MGLFDLLAATGAAKSHRHRNRPRAPAGDAGGLLGFLLGNSGPKPSAPSLADLLGLAPPPAPHVDQLPELVPRTDALQTLALRGEPAIPGSEIARETGPLADALIALQNAPVISSIHHSGEEAAHPHSFASHLKDISLPFLAGVGGPETAGLGRVGAAADEATGAAEAASRAARAASAGRSVGRGAVTGGKIAGRALTYPLRHPWQTLAAPAAAEVPGAIVGLDPSRLKRGLEGTGVLANIAGAASSGISNAVPGVAGNALADLFSLPAQVLPSTYMVGAALKEGLLDKDWSRGSNLWDAYKQTDFLPALASGDIPEALSRIGEHPVYAGLEGLGLYAGAGRAAGIAGRSGALGDTAAALTEHTRRPAHYAYGDLYEAPDFYSKNLFTSLGQHRVDARNLANRGVDLPEGIVNAANEAGLPLSPRGIQMRADAPMLSPRGPELARFLRDRTNRDVYAGEQVRRGAIRGAGAALEEARPADAAQADVVSLAHQPIAMNPETGVADLNAYRDRLLEERQAMLADPKRTWELEGNANMVNTIEDALKSPDPASWFNAAQQTIDLQMPVEQGLVAKGLMAPEQAQKAPLIPFARLRMGAGHGMSNQAQGAADDILAQMKDSDLTMHERGQLLGRLGTARSRTELLNTEGDPLSAPEISAEMRAQGRELPAGFLTQRPNARGPANWYRSAQQRPQIQGRQRTGQATLSGTFDPSFDALMEQVIGSTSVLKAAENFDYLGGQYAITAPHGYRFKNTGEANLAIQNPAAFNIHLPDVPGGWGTWRSSPWPHVKREMEAAQRDSNPASAAEGGQLKDETWLETDQPHLVEEALSRAYDYASGEGDGPVELIPNVVKDQLKAHFEGKRPIEKTLEAATGLFKGATLPTSPGWAAGNILDVYGVRAPISGITPGDMRIGKGELTNIVKEEMPADAAERLLESVTPGGLYAAHGRIQPHRVAEQFVHSSVEPVWRLAAAIRRTPGPKQVGDLYAKWRDAVFDVDAKFVEQNAQYGALTRQVRKDLDMTRGKFRQAVKDGDPAVRNLLRGLRNTDEQIRYAKSVESIFGNWGKNSPEARRWLTTWAPFWMWSRAAVKFAFITLPRDHPVLTGLIAASEQMTRNERQKLGLDFEGYGELPGFLQGGIPGLGGPGSITKASNLTTFGYFADTPAAMAGVAAPQAKSLLLAGLGLDWKGDKLVDADGKPASPEQRALVGFLSTADGYVPFLNVATQVLKHGPSGALPVKTYPASTVGFLRDQSESQQITVPADGSSSSSSSSGSVIDSLPGVGSGAGGSFINDLP